MQIETNGGIFRIYWLVRRMQAEIQCMSAILAKARNEGIIDNVAGETCSDSLKVMSEYIEVIPCIVDDSVDGSPF